MSYCNTRRILEQRSWGGEGGGNQSVLSIRMSRGVLDLRTPGGIIKYVQNLTNRVSLFWDFGDITLPCTGTSCQWSYPVGPRRRRRGAPAGLVVHISVRVMIPA